MVLQLTRILGLATDGDIAARLHDLEHAGTVEQIVLDRQDMARHRLRARTDRGTECAIALPRAERLANGAVLLLDASRAIVVRMAEEAWLRLSPRDAAAALELGYFCGNMHWRVRFEGFVIAIALDGPPAAYLDRMAHLIADGRVRRADHG
jgi:urease accessory protein